MKEKKITSKMDLSWLFKMAWRDGKASYKKLTLFLDKIDLFSY